MSPASLIVAGVVGLCIGLLILAFVLVYQEDRRKAATIAVQRQQLVELGAARDLAIAQRETALEQGRQDRDTIAALRLQLVEVGASRDQAVEKRETAVAERNQAVAQRDFAMDQSRQGREAIVELNRQLENVGRAKNLLHRNSIEDMQANDIDIALNVREMRARADTIELLLKKKGKVK